MAEVEAICAKLQNKPFRSRDERSNELMFQDEPSDLKIEDFNSRRRKRKANVPRFVNHPSMTNPDQTSPDKTCEALDLSINQSTKSDSDDIIQSRRFLHTSVTLPSLLRNPLANTLKINKDSHENFKYNFNYSEKNELSNENKRRFLISTVSKGDEDVNRLCFKSNNLDNTVKELTTQHPFDNDITTKGSTLLEKCEVPEDYLKRFSSYEDCKEEQCKQSILRDHYHCVQCTKTIIRREEMIRHSKWHKKREESLHFNFMRFSPGDDCNESKCSYNGRQTHYHCLYSGCNKIYISTSDVQMHSNYHKKDTAISKEGFQRYRATEMCSIQSCSYYNQRTTHFHCMRESCKFTFKNKADMDKHKGHHQRNDSLSNEGFRKYIKYEHCDYSGCKFSKLMNHIHCIRLNCDYVVHSSAQINSHRRKHERRLLATGSIMPSDHKSDSSSILNLSRNAITSNFDNDPPQQTSHPFGHNDPHSSILCALNNNKQLFDKISRQLRDWESRSQWVHETQRFTANDSCVTHCDLLHKDHYHCLFKGCSVAFWVKEKVRDHCRRHKIDDLLLHNCYEICTDIGHINIEISGPPNSHYHCRWTNCSYLRVGPEVTAVASMDFNFLREIYDHFDAHETRFHTLVNGESLNANKGQSSDESTDQNDIYQFITTEADKMSTFNVNVERKRGRPPKYKKNILIPKMELNDEDMNDDDSISELNRSHFLSSSNGVKCGFKFYPTSHVFCADDMCMFYGRSEHFHCLRPRCHHATDSMTAVNLHRREFHHYMQIEEGYGYFDRSVNCRRSHCQNNRVNNHYHCVRPNCDYSFKRFNTMHQHTRKHLDHDRPGSSLIVIEKQPVSSLKSDEEQYITPPCSFSASAIMSHYSRPFNATFPFPNGMFNQPTNISLPIIPALTSVGNPFSLNMNFDPLTKFNKDLSHFNNSFNGFLSNGSNCYPFFPEQSLKIPRLQLE